jgi:hypothetical protein
MLDPKVLVQRRILWASEKTGFASFVLVLQGLNRREWKKSRKGMLVPALIRPCWPREDAPRVDGVRRAPVNLVFPTPSTPS